MREARDADGVPAARLRAVLSDRRGDPEGPPDLPADDGPLQWSDIIPGWREEGGDGGGYPPGTAWATPPGMSAAPAPDHPIGEAASRPVGAVGGPSGEAEGIGLRSARFRTVGEDEPGLSGDGAFGGAGAFGGSGAFGGDGRRRWLNAFDPGRRGVRALAAVAVLVVVVASVLAWRARPRVDPVAQDAAEFSTASVPPARGATGTATEVVVAVGGKVRRPGLVRLAPGARVADALAAAGGAEPGVDVALLNPARKVTDGELILVGVTAPPGITAPPGVGGVPPGAAPGAAAAVAGGPVNLNTATLAQLDTLPGVGPVLAQRILDARAAQGGFRSVGDLRKVDGIGDSRYEQLKDLVTV